MLQKTVKDWDVLHKQDMRATGGGVAQAPDFEAQPASFQLFYEIFVVRFADETVNGILGTSHMETPNVTIK